MTKTVATRSLAAGLLGAMISVTVSLAQDRGDIVLTCAAERGVHGDHQVEEAVVLETGLRVEETHGMVQAGGELHRGGQFAGDVAAVPHQA